MFRNVGFSVVKLEHTILKHINILTSWTINRLNIILHYSMQKLRKFVHLRTKNSIFGITWHSKQKSDTRNSSVAFWLFLTAKKLVHSRPCPATWLEVCNFWEITFLWKVSKRFWLSGIYSFGNCTRLWCI